MVRLFLVVYCTMIVVMKVELLFFLASKIGIVLSRKCLIGIKCLWHGYIKQTGQIDLSRAIINQLMVHNVQTGRIDNVQ